MRLAWKPACDDINQSRIACGVPATGECADIGEDGGAVNESVFLPLPDKPLAVFFDFDIS
jgi:hypothetical protein